MKYSLRSLMMFSIRDLFWVLTLAAILTAWGIDHWQQETHRANEVNELYKLVQFESEWNHRLLRNPSAPAPNPPNP
jgi:hypothetical protein